VSFGRALVPAIAGATRIPYPRFLVWNVLGGASWAVTVTILGYAAGGSWQRVESVFGRAVLLLLCGVAVVVGVVVATRRIARRARTR